MLSQRHNINPYTAKGDYIRFQSVSLAHKISVIGNEMEFKHQICKCFVVNLTNISNFHSLKVVGRGSETQLQVSENLNYLI